MLRPYGDRILVEKLDGHGVETVSSGGIVLPAVEWGRGKTGSVPDTFRARVKSVGHRVAEVLGLEIAAGDEVIVYTYARDGRGSTLTGEETAYGLFIRAEDVIAVDPVLERVMAAAEACAREGLPAGSTPELAFLREQPGDVGYEARGSWARFML
jgi:co-chaperonin GroES (HSP10)